MADLIVEQRPEGRRVTITISTICEACIILERTIFSDESRELHPRLRVPRPQNRLRAQRKRV